MRRSKMDKDGKATEAEPADREDYRQGQGLWGRGRHRPSAGGDPDVLEVRIIRLLRSRHCEIEDFTRFVGGT